MTDANHRLAVYGTLAPGRPNAHELAHLGGTWTVGVLRGHLHEAGWGAGQGYPGIVLDPEGPEVEAHVLESTRLPDDWDRLDAFEGAEYRRVVTVVQTAAGPIDAFVYELAAS